MYRLLETQRSTDDLLRCIQLPKSTACITNFMISNVLIPSYLCNKKQPFQSWLECSATCKLSGNDKMEFYFHKIYSSVQKFRYCRQQTSSVISRLSFIWVMSLRVCTRTDVYVIQRKITNWKHGDLRTLQTIHFLTRRSIELLT